MIAMMLGNFVQIVIWGTLFIWLGEFSELYEAVYHSAVNFTALGYGDVVMSAQWKLLVPLAAANGVLMFGMTSAALMATTSFSTTMTCLSSVFRLPAACVLRRNTCIASSTAP
jgi:hypothetical protein